MGLRACQTPQRRWQEASKAAIVKHYDQDPTTALMHACRFSAAVHARFP